MGFQGSKINRRVNCSQFSKTFPTQIKDDVIYLWGGGKMLLMFGLDAWLRRGGANFFKLVIVERQGGTTVLSCLVLYRARLMWFYRGLCWSEVLWTLWLHSCWAEMFSSPACWLINFFANLPVKTVLVLYFSRDRKSQITSSKTVTDTVSVLHWLC